jgi:hypothetical protein
MRIPPVLLLALAAVASACETSSTPAIATLGPAGFAATVAPLSISPAFIRIPMGTSMPLAVNATPELANEVDWASLSPLIVTVDATGVVTGLSVGVATVQARFAFDFTNTAIATVEVTPVAVPVIPPVP